MKRFLIVTQILLAAGMLAAPAAEVPVQTADDSIEAIRAVLGADRQAVVSQAMQFTETEAEAFWPLYRTYRVEMARVGDGIKRLAVEYGHLYPEIPDDRARQMLKDLVSLEKEQVSIRASSLRRFAKVLPAPKVLRFAQIESRLDLAVRAELAAYIPLVPIEGSIDGTDSGGVLYQEGTAGGVAVRTRKISARVAAIDTTHRTVTLVNEAGIKETVKVSPEAINFDQVRVGDRLTVEATEEIIVRVAEPREATDTGAAILVDLAPKGAKPGGVVAGTARITGTVTGLDAVRRTATLRFEDGSVRTLPVRSDVDLARRQVGDRVVFHVTEMVAITVEKP